MEESAFFSASKPPSDRYSAKVTLRPGRLCRKSICSILKISLSQRRKGRQGIQKLNMVKAFFQFDWLYFATFAPLREITFFPLSYSIALYPKFPRRSPLSPCRKCFPRSSGSAPGRSYRDSSRGAG